MMCIAGAALSCAVILDFFPAICLFLLWAVYLSLVTVCEPFLDFQWDILLLQTGFLADFSRAARNAARLENGIRPLPRGALAFAVALVLPHV